MTPDALNNAGLRSATPTGSGARAGLKREIVARPEQLLDVLADPSDYAVGHSLG